jgi:lipopolysaccharide/colanic/teichoic acid biosynthesis glycosyltransferase
MRPGLIGLAQSRDLHGTAGHRWIAIRQIVRDVDYVTHFSLILDMKIIMRKAVNMFRDKTAL